LEVRGISTPTGFSEGVSDVVESGLRVGVLFSERADLLGALSDLARDDREIVLVAAATDRHHEALSVPATVRLSEFPTDQFNDRTARDLAIADWLVSLRVELVVCAGWLWLLPPAFLDRFPNHVVNVHPTLLPAFPGRHSVESAVAYGVRVHGVTVHLVDAGIDTGPILAQAASHFPKRVTASAVRAALAPLEQQQLCGVVQAFAQQRIHHDPSDEQWSIANGPKTSGDR
jgi:phosphoribosylglycinamide formyltransferase 1